MEELLQVENALQLLPPDWQARLEGSEVEPISSGMSGALVFRVLDSTCVYQKLRLGISGLHGAVVQISLP
jgi:hypothetical protein